MIGQTIAIFVDAYRDLNSRKLFWITLILSALFVIAMAIIGVDATGLKIFRSHFDMPMEQAQYGFKMVFRVVIVGIWLTWAATILALVSTAGIFPDLITGGSIDLYLSKPLSRWRLFITKYVAGLTFVCLQVIVVTVGGYLIMGLRGQAWIPELFLAIPIVICFFSYLFAICVFFGVLTRSTVAALLLTIGMWAVFAGIDWTDPWLLTMRDSMLRQADRLELVAKFEKPDETKPADSSAGPSAAERAQSLREIASRFDIAQRIVYGIKTVTPKTADTIDLLSRYVFTDEEIARSLNPPEQRQRRGPRGGGPFGDMEAQSEGAKQSAQEVRSRSVGWVIGTSLGFELVVVTLAGWIFCRRDY